MDYINRGCALKKTPAATHGGYEQNLALCPVLAKEERS